MNVLLSFEVLYLARQIKGFIDERLNFLLVL